jgi:hypothetical protein
MLDADRWTRCSATFLCLAAICCGGPASPPATAVAPLKTPTTAPDMPNCPASPPEPETLLSTCPTHTSAFRLKALLLVYDPTSGPVHGCKKLRQEFPNWPDVNEVIKGYAGDLTRASKGALCVDLVERHNLDELPRMVSPYFVAPDGGVLIRGYQLDRDAFFLNVEHYYLFGDGKKVELIEQGGPDYPWILNDPRFEIVGKIDSQSINVVWILAPPFIGFLESVMAGPNAYYINGGPIDGVGSVRRFATLFTSTDRGVAEWLHGTGHMVEWVMSHESGGWVSPWEYNGVAHTDWERFTTTEFANYAPGGIHEGGFSPGYAQVGTVHFPPNAKSDYDYANATVVDSYADDWYNYPDFKGEKHSVNRETWNSFNGDYQRGYMNWWYEHLPSYSGEHGVAILNNWWRYAFDLNRDAGASLAADARGDSPQLVCVGGRMYRMLGTRVEPLSPEE